MDFGWTATCPVCLRTFRIEHMSDYGMCEDCHNKQDTSLDLAELIRNRSLSFKRARQFASRRKR